MGRDYTDNPLQESFFACLSFGYDYYYGIENCHISRMTRITCLIFTNVKRSRRNDAKKFEMVNNFLRSVKYQTCINRIPNWNVA